MSSHFTAVPELDLFTPAYSAAVLRRVDEVLHGQDVPWPLDTQEAQLLQMLSHHVGKLRAATRKQLTGFLGLPDRTVRDMIRTLRVDFGLAIGSNRTAGQSGYYLVSSADEAAELAGPLRSQALSILRLHSSLTSTHATVELLGQLQLELAPTLPPQPQPRSQHHA